MHLAGDHLAQQGDHDIGAHQHEGEGGTHHLIMPISADPMADISDSPCVHA